jgi:hypothetical protein
VVIKSVFETRILAQLPALGKVTTTYVYDYANRLIALGSQGATATYGYDAWPSPRRIEGPAPVALSNLGACCSVREVAGVLQKFPKSNPA